MAAVIKGASEYAFGGDKRADGARRAGHPHDGDDNRTSVGVSSPTHPTYDAQDRLLTYPSLGASYTYTTNGELTSKTTSAGTTNYTYDVLGNLLHVGLPAALTDGTSTVDYVVDGQNRRVGRKVNGALAQGWLYQDQLRPVAQLDGTGTNVVARFVYGSKANVPEYMVTLNSSGTVLGTYRILSDHLGSPRLVVDANSGAVIETINFDEFGNETDTLAGTLPTGYHRIPFGFAGGLYDLDTGLVRFGARDYDASVGRWTAKDPTLFNGRRFNLYEYAGNDPVNAKDTSGLIDWGPLGGICCNDTSQLEWAITGDCTWESIPPGQCTSFAKDCDGFTCGGKFYKVHNLDAGLCNGSGEQEVGPFDPYPTPPWTPACGGGPGPPQICGRPDQNDPPFPYNWNCSCQ